MIWDKHVDKIQKSTDNSVPPETITNWVLTGDLANVEVNASEVSSWLDNLKEIRVSEPVASNKSSQILPEQSLHLKVVRGDKALYEISTQKIGNEWLIWSNDKPKEIYKASSYVLEGIFAHNDKLLKLPKPKIEGEASGLAWANNGSAFDLQKIVATWSLKSNGEQPKVKEDELKKVLDELKDLSAIDVLPKFKGKVAQSLTISANTTVVIEDLGKTELKDAHVVLIGDQVLALTSSSYDKLFPATNKLLDIPKPVAKNEDLTAFDNGVVKAEFKDKTWQLQDGRHLRTEAVDAWINSLNSLVESTYVPAMPSFTSKVHMSAKLAGADFQCLG